MSQLLKKYALLTACAVLALCFATRPAQAQTVAMGGTGEHLLFAYWSTADYTNTNVNIHSPLDVRDKPSDETMNVVRVVIRDAMGKGQADFKICLMPGDSWTATLSMDGLMVMDGGGCDESVHHSAGSRTESATSTPMMGEMMALGADSGYIEAWLAPTGGLVDDSVRCSPAGANCLAAGGFDTDLAEENATPSVISGSAMLVSAMSGFSSSYNAVALTGCGADATTAIASDTDDGNGCWVLGTADTAGTGANANGGPINAALSTLDMDLLTGRWTAISDMNVMSHTKVVVTFPVGNETDGYHQLNHTVVDDGEETAGTDPVSVYAFDDAGNISAMGTAMLGMNVNICMFGMMDMDDDHDHDHGDDMDMGDGMTSADMHGDDMDGGMPMLSCNDEMVDTLEEGMSGGFRIFNNNADEDPEDTNPLDGLEISGENADDGEEVEGLGIAAVAADSDSGQVAAEDFDAIGVVFSYFMGTDGMQYDQATPIQSISLPATSPEGAL